LHYIEFLTKKQNDLSKPKKRVFGSAKDKLASDFDAPLEDFKDYNVMKYMIDTHTFLWFISGT